MPSKRRQAPLEIAAQKKIDLLSDQLTNGYTCFAAPQTAFAQKYPAQSTDPKLL